MKKYCKIICIVTIGFSSSLFAEKVEATIDGLWSSTNTWTKPGGKTPTSSDAARIRANADVTLNSAGVADTLSVGIFNDAEAALLTITSGGSLAVSGTKILIGDRNDDVGILTIDGGSLSSTAGLVKLGSSDGAIGTLNVNSGSFSTGSSLVIGNGVGSSGTVNVNGGTLDFTKLFLGGANENATGTLNLDGGTTTIKADYDTAVVVDADNGKINMSDGVLKWLGGSTHVNVVESWVTNGLVEWSGTTDTMLYETWGFSATNATETSILYAYTDAADSNNSTFVWSVALNTATTNDYEGWASQYPTLSNAALTHDEEPDGLNNLMEYALGGNPTNDDAEAVCPTASLVEIDGESYIDYVYTRRTDAVARELNYYLEFSLALSSEGVWTNIANTELAPVDVGGGFEAVTNRVETAADSGFLKLTVEQQ